MTIAPGTARPGLTRHGVTEFGEDAAQRALTEALVRQTELIEEIRDQFAEHLELQRQILRLLMAERR